MAWDHYRWSQKGLYGGTGFPQAVQGKRGENYGESQSVLTIFVFCNLQRFKLEQRVLVVWLKPQNVSSVPSHFGTICCQMVQVRRKRLDLSSGVAHLKFRMQSGRSNAVDRHVLESMGIVDEEKMKTKDKSRKWMWGFLAGLVALQMYVVWEILAALAIFAVGFAAIAAVMGSLYMLVRTWAVTVERLAESKHPVMVAMRQGIDTAEEMARRPFRRPGSVTAR